MASLLDDPFVAEKIDRVVARYRHLWTDQQVRAFREAAAFTLATHPRASQLLELERTDAVDESGQRRKAGDRDEPKTKAE